MAYSLCGKSVANTGELACDKSRGVLKKLFIFNGLVASGDYADEKTLLAKLIANSKLSKDDSNKLFPLNEVQELADNSEANKEGSLNLGFKTILMEGKPAYTAKIFAGGDLLKRLRKFNGQTVRVFELDANGVLWGTRSGTQFRGFQAKMFFTGNKIATGQNVEEGVVEVAVSILSTTEYFDNNFWAELDGNIDDIRALNDVDLVYKSNAANVFKIGMEIKGSDLMGGYNIWDDYGTEISALTFTAFTGVDFDSPLTITSVAADNAMNALTVTFDATEYSGLSGGDKIRLVGPTPSVLDAADVVDTELIPVILTKS